MDWESEFGGFAYVGTQARVLLEDFALGDWALAVGRRVCTVLLKYATGSRCLLDYLCKGFQQLFVRVLGLLRIVFGSCLNCFFKLDLVILEITILLCFNLAYILSYDIYQVLLVIRKLNNIIFVLKTLLGMRNLMSVF